MTTVRVTITIPGDLVEAADRRAAEEHRSRSWVLAEALRAYLTPAARGARSLAPPAAAGLGPSRHAQLEADLALSPEERVRLAEQTALVRPPDQRRGRRDQVLTFDRLEDFFAWEKREAIGS
jgi:hypothetical protein